VTDNARPHLFFINKHNASADALALCGAYIGIALLRKLMNDKLLSNDDVLDILECAADDLYKREHDDLRDVAGHILADLIRARR